MKPTRRRVLLLALPIILGGAMWPVARAHRQRAAQAATQELWEQMQQGSATPAELERLLLLGADVNAPDNSKSRRAPTMLHYAAIGDPDIVRLLLDHGANVNAQDFNGVTPLMSAAGGQPETMHLMLSQGANVKLRNRHGDTALHAAVSAPDGSSGEAPVEMLINHGADVNAANVDGATPLHYAIMQADGRLVEILLQSGANVQARSKRFGTPLHQATDISKRESGDIYVRATSWVIRLLRQAGAKE